MRVLHLCGEYPPRRLGGVATYVENVAREQRAAHDVGVVVLEGRGYRDEPSDGPAAQVVRLDLERLLEPALVEPDAAADPALKEGLLGERWDIVHVHDWYGAWPAMALQARTRAIVMTAHLPLRFGFSYANHALPFRAKSRLEALGFRLSARVVAPSRYVATLLAREYDVPSAVLRVVQNGVDLDTFAPAGAKADAPTALSVSRLTAQKGLPHLLAAFGRVRARLPEARLEIVGDGPARAELEAMAGQGVRFLGHVPHRELPAIYARAHAFVSASLHEPFGLTTLEAMACGTAAVVSPLGGTAEFVEDGESGYVRRPHAADELADGVAALLGDGTRAARMGAAARARAATLSWGRTARGLDAVYEEALA